MNILDYFVNFFKRKKDIVCDQSEHCPIYLEYLGKYGENSEEIKMCKNSNKKYCKKYNLIDQNVWNKIGIKEKINLIKKMDFLKYIHKK